MNLPNNIDLYVDANFITAVFIKGHGDHKTAIKLFALLLINKNTFNFTPLTLDETLHAIWKTKRSLKRKNNKLPDVSHSYFYNDYKKVINSLIQHAQVQLRQFENDLSSSCIQAIENIRDYDLRPKDAFHLSYMKDFGINTIVSNDSDFDKLKNINIEKIGF